MRRIVLASLLLIMTMMVFSCATPTPETKIVEKTVVVEKPVEKVVTVIVQPTVAAQPKAGEPAKAVDLKAIEAAYKLSSHSNDWGEGRGPNTFCARCHSPRNWDPKAVAGPAPNCVACKFPADPAVRKPPPGTNVFIEQKDWKNIGCDVCHQVNSAGVVDPKPVMWNQATGKYDAVATTTELCEGCHTDSIGGSKHKMMIGGPAHTGQIGLAVQRPNQCTDCHNPHSQQASCDKCHANVMTAKPNTGHTPAHAKVTCSGCHDASGATVAWTMDKTKFATTHVVSSPAGTSVQPYSSHVLQRKVDCARCHYEKNPFNLSVIAPAATGRPSATATPTK